MNEPRHNVYRIGDVAIKRVWDYLQNQKDYGVTEMTHYQEKYVAEYDPIDEIFHIQTLKETIEGNFRCAAEGRAHHYLLMGLFDDSQEASRFCDAIQDELRKRVTV